VDGERFAFAFDPRYVRVLSLLGIRPATSWVELSRATLRTRFGPWRLETPIPNIACARVTGPYLARRAIGPRISLKDRGLSFGSNIERGVCLLFDEAVPGGETLGLLRHPGLTVTVADPDGFVAAIEAVRSGA